MHMIKHQDNLITLRSLALHHKIVKIFNVGGLKMNNMFDDAKRKVFEINWSNIGKIDKISNIALAKEYLRRASVLLKQNSLTAKFPFFNASKVVSGDTQIDILKICPEFESLEQNMAKFVCQWYLEWAILIENGNSVAIEHKDLYEPLIKLFQRGGYIGLHHGDVAVGKYTLPLNHWNYTALEEPINISDEALDSLDVKNE